MIIPGCIYHRAGLRPMRETRRAQSAGFEYTELRFPSWECESPDCDGLYDNNAGYYRPRPGEKLDSMLSVVWG